tara:strand:+ start:875 stop:1867 length:993 start_codon:yes stop_codon:yes gene_type:complete
MKKSITKKLFIKICKILGYEIIDQNEFYSPTLNKPINNNLSNEDKSIILPLGEVKLTKKIKSLLILFRTNTNIEIWDQNKRRIFEFPKIEYVLRCLNSLIKSIIYLKEKNNNLNIKVKIIDDNSNNENLKKINDLIKKSGVNIEIINHNNDNHKNEIKKQTSNETFANLSSLLKCFEIGKNEGEDLVFFVEDDYLHFKTCLNEMISTYERISSQTNKDLFLCPSDYPFLYMNEKQTNLLIGSNRHWRTIDKTLCTFLTSHNLIKKYWDNFYNNCLDRHDPFEKYLNMIYEKEICISPIKSLSIHLTNINSSYGLAPFIDYKSLWDENNYK